MIGVRREGLSKPVLTALFACRTESVSLSSLRRIVGKVIARRSGRKAKYLPPKVFFSGVSGRRRLVKALEKFLERGVISVSGGELFRRMASADSESDFDRIWKSGGKNVMVYINKKTLIELAIVEKRVKESALSLIRRDQSLSVGQAIALAKRELKAKKSRCSSGKEVDDKRLRVLSQMVLQVLKSESTSEVGVIELMRKLIDCKIACSYPILVKALLRLREMKLVQLYDKGKVNVWRYYEVIRLANNKSLKPLTRRNKIHERVEHFRVKLVEYQGSLPS